MSLNCYGHGRLARDAELKEVTGGTVVQLSLATDRKYGKKGEDRKTDFFDVSVYVPTDDKFNQLEAAKKLVKGLLVFLPDARVEIDETGEGKEKKRYTKVRIGSIFDVKYDPASGKLKPAGDTDEDPFQ